MTDESQCSQTALDPNGELYVTVQILASGEMRISQPHPLQRPTDESFLMAQLTLSSVPQLLQQWRVAQASSVIDDTPVRHAHLEMLEGLVAQIPDFIQNVPDEASTQNLRWMAARIKDEVESFPIDKQGRWIGFIQGVLTAIRALNVETERNRTRPIFHRAYTSMGWAIPKTQSRES